MGGADSTETAAMGLIEGGVILIGMVLVAFVIFTAFSILEEERWTEGSAANVTSAVKAVYDCNVNKEGEDCETTATAIISLKQPNPVNMQSGGDDPRWTVYYRRNPGRTPGCTLTGFVAGGCWDPAGIYVTWAESDVGAIAGFCEQGTCYGTLERKNLEHKSFQEANAPEVDKNKIDDFWFTSPCFAEVEAYWDSSKEQVRFRVTKNLNPTGTYKNFCCNDNDVAGSFLTSWFDSDWPELGAFKENGRGDLEGKRSDGKGYFCDFMR